MLFRENILKLFANRVVFVPMLWSLSTTERSMLVTATSVDTFTLSYNKQSEYQVTLRCFFPVAIKPFNAWPFLKGWGKKGEIDSCDWW